MPAGESFAFQKLPPAARLFFERLENYSYTKDTFLCFLGRKRDWKQSSLFSNQLHLFEA